MFYAHYLRTIKQKACLQLESLDQLSYLSIGFALLFMFFIDIYSN